MEFLEIRNLYKSFDNKSVIRNLSFTLNQGQRLCILGENGSGKTTLLKMIAGWENPDAGGIFLENKIVEGFGKKLVKGHKDIILLNQNYQLNNQLSVFENLMMVLKHLSKSQALEIADEMTELFRLQTFKDKRPTELSGGQRQRSCMAQCFALFPKLLLLDEPFSNQDHRQKELLMADLLKINKQWETTLIYVTHDAIDALAFSTDTIILQNGRIIQRDQPKSIYDNPINESVALLTGDLNKLEKDMLKLLKIKFEDGYSYFIRPEHITLADKEGINAELIEELYCGFDKKLRLKISDSECWLYLFEREKTTPATLKVKIETSKILKIKQVD